MLVLAYNASENFRVPGFLSAVLFHEALLVNDYFFFSGAESLLGLLHENFSHQMAAIHSIYRIACMA